MGSTELWQSFPKTLEEFDEQFPDEAACRRYLIDLRWGGNVRCARCECDEIWELQNGRFECKRCSHQTSVTAGTLLHRTRKPLRLWFRAMWEMAVRKGESTRANCNESWDLVRTERLGTGSISFVAQWLGENATNLTVSLWSMRAISEEKGMLEAGERTRRWSSSRPRMAAVEYELNPQTMPLPTLLVLLSSATFGLTFISPPMDGGVIRPTS